MSKISMLLLSLNNLIKVHKEVRIVQNFCIKVFASYDIHFRIFVIKHPEKVWVLKMLFEHYLCTSNTIKSSDFVSTYYNKRVYKGVV